MFSSFASWTEQGCLKRQFLRLSREVYGSSDHLDPFLEVLLAIEIVHGADDPVSFHGSATECFASPAFLECLAPKGFSVSDGFGDTCQSVGFMFPRTRPCPTLGAISVMGSSFLLSGFCSRRVNGQKGGGGALPVAGGSDRILNRWPPPGPWLPWET